MIEAGGARSKLRTREEAWSLSGRRRGRTYARLRWPRPPSRPADAAAVDPEDSNPSSIPASGSGRRISCLGSIKPAEDAADLVAACAGELSALRFARISPRSEAVPGPRGQGVLAGRASSGGGSLCQESDGWYMLHRLVAVGISPALGSRLPTLLKGASAAVRLLTMGVSKASTSSQERQLAARIRITPSGRRLRRW